MSDTNGFGLWSGAVLDLPAPLVAPADAFWTAALGWKVGPPWEGLPEFHPLVPPDGDSHVLVQVIEGPPRVHLDLYTDDLDAEAERLAGLGAADLERGAYWRVLSSPVGFPFCLVPFESERDRPRAQTWPDGHRSRLVQVCLDVPHGRVDEELSFWRTATGWSFEASGSPEFAGHLRPAKGGSLQLLIQELGESDPASTTRAHLDLGTDDVEAEVARLVSLGAERLEDGRGWIVMRDPAGLVFCVTGQAPQRPG